MPTTAPIYVEADVACWTSGIAAGQGNHLPVGYYGSAVYRSAMRFAIPAWGAWTSIDSATLTFFISDHNHVAPSGGTHYVSRQTVANLWTKGAGGTDCETGFSGGNNTQNSDIPSTSTDRASFLCGVTANATKSVNVTAAVNYYRNNGASKMVFVFEASASGEYTEIWAQEKSGYDAYLQITYTDASAPNPPDLTAPANLSTVVSNHPDLSFIPRDVQNNAHTSYHYQVATDPTFATGIAEDLTVSGSFASNATVTRTVVATLTRGTTYYWRVQTTDATGTGGWSTNAQFTVKALPVVTVENIRREHYANGAVRLEVRWTADQVQTHYRVQVASPSFDSGWLAGTASAYMLDTVNLTNGTAAAVTVSVRSDPLPLEGSASRSFTPRWGLTTHKKTLSGVPINWQTPVVVSTVPKDAVNGDTQLIIEYGSAAAAADSAPTAWYTALSDVPKTQYLHWRAWFIPNNTLGPTLDSINILFDQTAAVIDKWGTTRDVEGVTGQWKIDTGESVYGTRSITVDCNGSAQKAYAFGVKVRAGRSYILTGLMKSGGTPASLGNSGAHFRLETAAGVILNGGGITGPAGPCQSDILTATKDWFSDDSRDVNRYKTPVYTADTDGTIYVVLAAQGVSGAKAWWDAIKFEESTVATPWSPGAIGATVLDAGGIQIDGTKGGVFRLRGSDNLPGSVIELGAAGLYQGGALMGGVFVGNSPPAIPANGQLWWDDDDATGGGSDLAGRGTAFPATPGTYDTFFRTDLGSEWFWNGTFWVPLGYGVLAVAQLKHASVDTTMTGFGAAVTDIDATNLAATFVAPASGKVLVTLSLQTAQVTTATNIYYAVREATTLVAQTLVEQTNAGLSQHSPAWLVTGLVPGSTHTYKGALWKATSGTANVYHGPTYGALVIKVEGVP